MNELTIYDALRSGFSICLCKVIERNSRVDANNALMDFGEVTLRIEECLYGQPRSSIELNYAFVKSPSSTAYFDARILSSLWPSFEVNDFLLCVISSKGKPSVNQVLILKDKTDPRILEFEEICSLYKKKDSSEFIAQTEKALKSGFPILQAFAAEMLIKYGGRNRPEESIKLVQKRASAYKNSAKCRHELSYFVNVIQHLLFRHLETEQMNKWLWNCLLLFADSESVAVKPELLRILIWADELPKFNFHESLDEFQINKLQKILNKSKFDKSDEQSMNYFKKIRAWV